MAEAYLTTKRGNTATPTSATRQLDRMALVGLRRATGGGSAYKTPEPPKSNKKARP